MISNHSKDMDAEIVAPEGKLSKVRQVKAGMMSVLLTGRSGRCEGRWMLV
jgi:hypothetical protein